MTPDADARCRRRAWLGFLMGTAMAFAMVGLGLWLHQPWLMVLSATMPVAGLLLGGNVGKPVTSRQPLVLVGRRSHLHQALNPDP